MEAEVIVSLSNIRMALEELKASLFDIWLSRIGSVLTLGAFLFSIWLYLSDKFKQRFNFLSENISYFQMQTNPRYFLDQLDNIFVQGNIDFERADFIHSRIYSYIIKFAYEMLMLIERNKCGRSYYLSLFKTMLSNESVWVCSIYALQNTEIYGVKHKEFQRLWVKHRMLDGICLFNASYGLDELQKMTLEEMEQIDERIYSNDDIHKVILNELITRLNPNN